MSRIRFKLTIYFWISLICVIISFICLTFSGDKTRNNGQSLILSMVCIYSFRFICLEFVSAIKRCEKNFQSHNKSKMIPIVCLFSVIFLLHWITNVSEKSFPDWSFVFLCTSLLVFYEVIKMDFSYLSVYFKRKSKMGSLYANAACRSFYKNVCGPELFKRVCQFEKDNNVSIVLKKLIIVIPYSCDVRGTFDDVHKNIKYIDELPIIDNDQGANMNRRYKNPVYKLTDDIGKSMYILLESPSAILTLWHLKSNKKISEDVMNYERKAFIKTLQEELADYECLVFEYDDKSSSFSQFLFKMIKSELEKEKYDYTVNLKEVVTDL